MLMTTLVACYDSDTLEERKLPVTKDESLNEENVPVEFTVSDQRTIDFTRAATSIISFDASENVKVFVKPSGAATYTGYDYTTATAGQNVSLTTPASPPYYPPGANSTVEAYAYYPSTANTSFSVMSDQTSNANYKASDLMYADNRTVTKGATDNHHHLSMAHQMAQLAITAQAQAGSGITITGVEVIAKTDVTFDPDPNATRRVTTTGSDGIVTALNEAGTGYIVIPPQAINGVRIKIITGAGTSDLIATYAFTGTGSFESGNSYALDLTVSADQLGFTTAINNWNGVGSVNVVPAGSLTISPILAQEFTGSALEPSFTVTKGDEIVAPTLYDVTWVNNVNAGKAYIIVTGKDTQEGAVGMASFTITPANGKIEYAVTSRTEPYGTMPFIHPLSNHDTRPGFESLNADGEVSFLSSDPTVATVDATTGEVTLQQAGTTRITATASNGANYVYSTSAGDHSAYYDLIVTRAPATISFGFSNPSQSWSPNTANNIYTQTVTNTGDATVTYRIGDTNTCNASINSTTGEVSFNKSGSVEVIAEIPATDTDCYAYSSTSTSYTLNVNKIDGFVTLSETSGSVGAGSNLTIKVSDSHGGTLSAAATGGSTVRVGTISVNGNNITVPTNGITPANVTITVTCAPNDYYNTATTTYNLNINGSVDIKMNPLWYVAEYNMTNTTTATTLTMGTNLTHCYFYTWADAMAKFSNNSTSKLAYYWGNKTIRNQSGTWHLPTVYEMNSIIPSSISPTNWVSEVYVSIPTNIIPEVGTGATFNKSVKISFGYNDATKGTGGTYMTESSYWYRKSEREFYAIRYCGTNYCSVWKYELTGDAYNNNLVLTITSKLLGVSLTTAQANSSFGTNETKWESEFANLTFTSSNSNIDNTYGAVQRTFYGAGDRINSSGASSDDDNNRGRGIYWTATEGSNIANTTFNNANYLLFHNYSIATNHNGGKAWGFPVRLFRDN